MIADGEEELHIFKRALSRSVLYEGHVVGGKVPCFVDFLVRVFIGFKEFRLIDFFYFKFRSFFKDIGHVFRFNTCGSVDFGDELGRFRLRFRRIGIFHRRNGHGFCRRGVVVVGDFHFDFVLAVKGFGDFRVVGNEAIVDHAVTKGRFVVYFSVDFNGLNFVTDFFCLLSRTEIQFQLRRGSIDFKENVLNGVLVFLSGFRRRRFMAAFTGFVIPDGAVGEGNHNMGIFPCCL